MSGSGSVIQASGAAGGARGWEEIMAQSLVTAEALERHLPVDADAVNRVIRRYPMRINPYFLSVIQSAGGPLWRQAIPDTAELSAAEGLTPDPLDEEPQSPVPHLIHRYPDRVVFMVSNQCAMYCRHCMRKRQVGRQRLVTGKTIARGLDYIRKTPAVQDVILSGGDPLLISDEQLDSILSQLKKIPHVAFIRIHSRVPCTLPARITSDLALLLASYQPLYMNLQFNHPAELTDEARTACARLADAGICLGSQSVLLKGVNDDPHVMADLMKGLLKSRIRPYYLHHADPVAGTRHFRTSIEKGLEIMRFLRGRISGMGVPYYMIDLPGGGGKVPLLPEYTKAIGEDRIRVLNYQGRIFEYPVNFREH